MQSNLFQGSSDLRACQSPPLWEQSISIFQDKVGTKTSPTLGYRERAGEGMWAPTGNRSSRTRLPEQGPGAGR